MCQIAPISMVDTIITDDELDTGILAQFEANDIKIILA